MNKNKNLKGMTLVECIIAMCVLGAIAGMFVTVAVKAKNMNAQNYKRSNTMYEQAAAAENTSGDEQATTSEAASDAEQARAEDKTADEPAECGIGFFAGYVGYLTDKASAYGFDCVETREDQSGREYQSKARQECIFIVEFYREVIFKFKGIFTCNNGCGCGQQF